MAEAQYEEALAVCRGMWEFAAVLDFLARFRAQLGLPEADADTLERALIFPFHSEALELTHVRLLQELQQEEVNLFSWPRVLFEALGPQLAYLRWLQGEGEYEALAAEGAAAAAAPRPASLVQATLDARGRYEALAVGMRVRILHELCGRVLDAPAARAALVDGGGPGAAATAPLGADGAGRHYWFFAGVPRLFRGTPPQARPAAAADGPWETCAADEAQWAALLEALAASDAAADRLLHGVLARTVAPQLRRLEAERRAAVQRELQQLPRKRSTRLQEKQLQAREGPVGEALDQAASVAQVKLYHEGRLQEMLRAEEQKAREREARQLEQQRREAQLEAARAKEREEKERARVARRQRRASSIGEEYLEAALEQMGALAARKAAPEPVEDPVLDRPCVPCRKGHVRCDRQYPCGRCTKKGIEDACEESVTGRRPFEEAARIRAEKEARLRALTEGIDAAHAQQGQAQHEAVQQQQQQQQPVEQEAVQQEAVQQEVAQKEAVQQQPVQQEVAQQEPALEEAVQGQQDATKQEPVQYESAQQQPVQQQPVQQQPVQQRPVQQQPEQQQPVQQQPAQQQPVQEHAQQQQAAQRIKREDGQPQEQGQAMHGNGLQAQESRPVHGHAALGQRLPGQQAPCTPSSVEAKLEGGAQGQRAQLANGLAHGANGLAHGSVQGTSAPAAAALPASTEEEAGVLGKRIGATPQEGAKRPRQGPL